MANDPSFSLEQLQQWMQETIVQQEQRIDTGTLIRSSKRLSAQQHLGIYQRSYTARLRECMKNQFGALAHALGDDLFRDFADEYLTAYPSGSYTLNDLGKNFSAFLQETRPDAQQENKESWPDFMIELAQFEFDITAIFDEPAEEKTTGATSVLPDENLQLIPVFHLFHHRFPISRYYLDFVAGKNPELPFEEETCCVVLRKNYRLGIFSIKPAQFVFLSEMKKGEKVPEALEKMKQHFAFDEKTKQELWKKWRENFIASGFFTRKVE
jgi:hypothetical protein